MPRAALADEIQEWGMQLLHRIALEAGEQETFSLALSMKSPFLPSN